MNQSSRSQDIHIPSGSEVKSLVGEYKPTNEISLEGAMKYVAPSPKRFLEDFIGIIKTPEYKFNEDTLVKELMEYINSTYDQHYSQSKLQTTEIVIDQGYGEGWCKGNVWKYSQRYGKKNGYQRVDVLKALHYALILLHVHDLEHSDETE